MHEMENLRKACSMFEIESICIFWKEFTSAVLRGNKRVQASKCCALWTFPNLLFIQPLSPVYGLPILLFSSLKYIFRNLIRRIEMMFQELRKEI
jgi:hypothetical protein